MSPQRGSSAAPRAAQATRLTCLLALAVWAGCVGPLAPCAGIGNFAVVVTVVDSTTAGPPSSQPTLTIMDGTFVDTLVGPAPGQSQVVVMGGAAERPGTYSLTVTAAGYRRWMRDGVRAREGGRCDDLQTVRLTARLQPAAEPSAHRLRISWSLTSSPHTRD